MLLCSVATAMIFLLWMQSLVTSSSTFASSAVLCLTAALGSKLNTWKGWKFAFLYRPMVACLKPAKNNAETASDTLMKPGSSWLTHLGQNEGTFQATLAGAISQQVSPYLLQARKHGATGTKEIRGKELQIDTVKAYE